MASAPVEADTAPSVDSVHRRDGHRPVTERSPPGHRAVTAKTDAHFHTAEMDGSNAAHSLTTAEAGGGGGSLPWLTLLRDTKTETKKGIAKSHMETCSDRKNGRTPRHSRSAVAALPR